MSFDEDVITLMILIGVLWWGDCGGYLMQRISACRNEKDAIKSTLFVALFQLARPWMWGVVALVSIVMFPVLEEGQTNTDVYPMVMNVVLGPGIKGLLVTAFLAAFMSTIDTHLNWGASYLMTDIYTRFINPEPTTKQYMRAARACVVLLMLLSAVIVSLIPSVTDAWEIFAFLGVGGGIIGVLRWFWWRINAWTELTAILGALTCTIVHLILLNSNSAIGQHWADLEFTRQLALFTAIVFPASIIVTFLTPPVAQEKLESFYRKVRPGGFWGGVSEEARALKGAALGRRTLLDIALGICLTFGVSLAIGNAILLQWTYAAISVGVAIVGAIGTYFWYQREVADLE
jgi:SSS family solute:Na+ symporter